MKAIRNELTRTLNQQKRMNARVEKIRLRCANDVARGIMRQYVIRGEECCRFLTELMHLDDHQLRVAFKANRRMIKELDHHLAPQP